jgi:hypothetical protein
MKSLFLLTLASAGLLLAAGMANGQNTGTRVQPRGRAILEQTRTSPRKTRRTCRTVKPGKPAR